MKRLLEPNLGGRLRLKAEEWGHPEQQRSLG